VTSRHRARETVELLKWRPQISFLLGPGCKSGRLQSVVGNGEKVYKKRIKDIEELRARILTAWDKMDRRIIDKAVRQWQSRLHACIKAKGGHFKHTLRQ